MNFTSSILSLPGDVLHKWMGYLNHRDRVTCTLTCSAMKQTIWTLTDKIQDLKITEDIIPFDLMDVAWPSVLRIYRNVKKLNVEEVECFKEQNAIAAFAAWSNTLEHIELPSSTCTHKRQKVYKGDHYQRFVPGGGIRTVEWMPFDDYTFFHHKPRRQYSGELIHMATKASAAGSIEKMLTLKPDLVHAVDFYGHTPLLLAIQLQNTSLMRLLLQYNAKWCYKTLQHAMDIHNGYHLFTILLEHVQNMKMPPTFLQWNKILRYATLQLNHQLIQDAIKFGLVLQLIDTRDIPQIQSHVHLEWKRILRLTKMRSRSR